jgi:hypothetical protein
MVQILENPRVKIIWQLHSCPKCEGDLFSENDGFTCLQCGCIKSPLTDTSSLIEESNSKYPMNTTKKTNQHNRNFGARLLGTRK